MITFEIPQLDEIKARLRNVPEGANWAIMRTLNDVAESGQKVALQAAFKRYNLKEGDIRKGFTVMKATTGRLVAVIRVSGRRFPIQMFSPRMTTTGVAFEEVRGTQSAISHAFMATMRYGANVFARQGPKRGPVQMQTGLSVANMVREQEEVLPAVEARIREQFSKRAEYWVSEALKGNRTKYGAAGGEGGGEA
jgi:hypothetical protein